MKKTNYLKALICVAASVALIGCSGTRYSRSTGQYIDDKTVSARVNSALVKDSMIAANDVNVQTFRGNVHLTGFVDHSAQKERASQLTRNVQGVQWFKNDILVKESLPGEARMLSDQTINEASGAERTPDRDRDASRADLNGKGQGADWQRGSLGFYDPAGSISVEQNRAAMSPRASEQQRSYRAQSADISSEPAGSSNVRAGQDADRLQRDAGGKIKISGKVATEVQKRAIEQNLRSIEGVTEIENDLEVDQ